MIQKSDLLEIGKFQKTHALQGELNAILDVEEDYVEAGHPFIVEVEGIPVPFYPESIRPKGNTSYLVKLAGIDTQEKAQEFVNDSIYGLRKDLADYFESDPEEMVTESDLLGAQVVDDEKGEIGILTHVDTSTPNTLLIVETPSGEEVFIPYVDEFIQSYDPERKVIHVSLPEGLAEINFKNKEENE